MPVIAVGAAVWGGMSLAAGVTGFAAIAAIGAIVAGVGVVTGNKDLLKIGGVMGLVGGVGSLASRSGLLTEAVAADQFTGMTAETAATITQPGLLDTGAVIKAAAAPIDIGTYGATPVDTGTYDADAMLKSPPAQSPAASAAEAARTEAAAVDTPRAKAPVYDINAMLNSAPEEDFFDNLLGKTKDVAKVVKENQVFFGSVLKVGGSFLEALFDPLADVKKKQLESQSAYYEANAAGLLQQSANIRAPAPIAVAQPGPRPNVFPGGPIPVYNRPIVGAGIINGVTGRV